MSNWLFCCRSFWLSIVYLAYSGVFFPIFFLSLCLKCVPSTFKITIEKMAIQKMDGLSDIYFVCLFVFFSYIYMYLVHFCCHCHCSHNWISRFFHSFHSYGIDWLLKFFFFFEVPFRTTTNIFLFLCLLEPGLNKWFVIERKQNDINLNDDGINRSFFYIVSISIYWFIRSFIHFFLFLFWFGNSWTDEFSFSIYGCHHFHTFEQWQRKHLTTRK